MQAKLAEALLRRKELSGKVAQLAAIKEKDIFQIKMNRKAVSDGIDDIVLHVPLLSAKQVTAEHDHYARQLRLVDAAIQQANWTTVVEFDQSVMADYVPPDLVRKA